MSNKGKKVSIHYVSKDEEGVQIESTRAFGQTIDFVCGDDQIIDALDEAVTEMEVGETRTVTVMNAYGPYRLELLKRIEGSEVAGIASMPVGKYVVVEIEGEYARAKVVEVAEDHALVDANHPYAGKEITFEVELVSAE